MYKESSDNTTFAVRVLPRSSKNQIVVEGDAIKVRLTAPPVEGKANDALVKFLSEILGISRGQIEIISGERAKQKIVRVRGMSSAKIKEKIAR